MSKKAPHGLLGMTGDAGVELWCQRPIKVENLVGRQCVHKPSHRTPAHFVLSGPGR